MLKLVKHPDPILQQIMKEFSFENPIMDPYEIEEQMVKLMQLENGRGLSANQVGIDARVFVIKTEKLQDVKYPFAVFNPKIIAASETQNQDYEGCLSFPNLFLPIKRHNHIIVEFLDRDNKQHIIRLDDIDARCFLHEYDHLNGTCFTDGLSKLKLDLAIKRQRKLNGRTQQRITASI